MVCVFAELLITSPRTAIAAPPVDPDDPVAEFRVYAPAAAENVISNSVVNVA